jgi:hypothetical protein
LKLLGKSENPSNFVPENDLNLARHSVLRLMKNAVMLDLQKIKKNYKH